MWCKPLISEKEKNFEMTEKNFSEKIKTIYTCVYMVNFILYSLLYIYGYLIYYMVTYIIYSNLYIYSIYYF